MNVTPEQLKAIQARGRKDPVWFIKNVLNVPYVTPQQVSLCRSMRDNRRTAAPSGHGVGKTFIAACCCLWFLFCFPNSKVITTAPTWMQVEALLWKDTRAILSRSLFVGLVKPLATSLTLTDEWFAIGLSTNQPTNFQGHHAPYIFIIIDEATGVDPVIWEASEGNAVGTNDRFLAIGNPTDPTSEFKRKCDSGIWNVLELSCEEHPNVVEGREVVPGAVTREWVAERLEEYGGRDTALYRARVLGKFPEQGDDMLISLADVERARLRWSAPAQAAAALGVDVARFGSDETVEIEIHPNGVIGQPKAFRGQDTMQTAGRVLANPAPIKAVDDSGVGGGVTDRLREQNVDVIAYLAGERAFEPERFLNRRAETWWMIREALKKNEISLPPDDKLAADLTNIKFTYTSRGQIKLESKDDIKKRLGRSPDRGDALAIALAALHYPVFTVSDKERDAFAGISL